MVGFILTLILVLGYERALLTGQDVAHARSMAMVTLIFASTTITYSLSASLVGTASLISVVSTLVSVLLIQSPVTSHWLHLTPLHLDDWILASSGGVVVGLGASLFRRPHWPPGEPDRQADTLSA
jgi:P-type Ca2+ transporter type 2C